MIVMPTNDEVGNYRHSIRRHAVRVGHVPRSDCRTAGGIGEFPRPRLPNAGADLQISNRSAFFWRYLAACRRGCDDDCRFAGAALALTPLGPFTRSPSLPGD